jgi:hypothetical protein
VKRYILAPLCSAFIIPGLGQIVNQDLKKGGLILCAVFLLFIVGTVKLVFIVKSMVSQSGIGMVTPPLVMERLGLWVIIGPFIALWLYSVLDAFLKGWAKDRNNKR